MELVATGRTAEVFAVDPGRVVKVDRPGWEGLAVYELGVLERVHAAGLPVPRPYGVVDLAGRQGVEMEMLPGPTLEAVLEAAPGDRVGSLAVRFAALQREVQAAAVDGLPDLVPRLRDEVGRSGLPGDVVDELVALLGALPGEPAGLCHGDLHPGNVVVTPDGWRVVDWVNAARGPCAADVARTLVLLDERTSDRVAAFRSELARVVAGGAVDPDAARWLRVVAAARRVELT